MIIFIPGGRVIHEPRLRRSTCLCISQPPTVPDTGFLRRLMVQPAEWETKASRAD